MSRGAEAPVLARAVPARAVVPRTLLTCVVLYSAMLCCAAAAAVPAASVTRPPPPGPREGPPPSHTRTPPSHTRTPPSHTRTPPSHIRTPPSHTRTPPSHTRTPPSHIRTPPAMAPARPRPGHATGVLRGRVPPVGPWGKPVLTENFTGSQLDRRRWFVYHDPHLRANPRTAKATRVADGRLQLTGGLYGGRDLSGGVASRLYQKYGRWQVRMRAERGVGYSAVALLWPRRFGDPEFAEINFAEVLDPNRRRVGLFVHHGEDDRQAHRGIRVDFTRWHTVTLDWLPDRLTFWLDAEKVWTYHGPLIPHRTQMGLTLQNDQVCDLGPRFCRDRSTPKWVTMDVDWVRIWRPPPP
jgi:glycosyl hydrolase family 16